VHTSTQTRGPHAARARQRGPLLTTLPSPPFHSCPSLPPPLLSRTQPPGYPPPQQGGYPQPVGYPQQPVGFYPQQQPVGYPQPVHNPVMMVVAGGPPPPAFPDLLSALGPLPGALVAQDVSWVEVLSGCDTQNKYSVSAWDPSLGQEKPTAGVMGSTLLRFKEKSNCLERQVCGPRRGFRMIGFPASSLVATSINESTPTDTAIAVVQDALVLERPFRCTFLCFQRSLLRVNHRGLGAIGEILNPFTFLHPTFLIRAPQPLAESQFPIAEMVKADSLARTVHYVVRGSLCQWGMWAPPLPCGPCRKITFSIYDPTDVDFVRPLGEICKVWSGCFREALSTADTYTVQFPKNADALKKALLVACTFLIDFLFFENKPKDENNNAGLLSMLA
jgi:hypothetical protein